MIERRYTYYSGKFESQFELVQAEGPLSGSIREQHTIQLHPKFRLFCFEKITEEAYNLKVEAFAQLKHIRFETPIGKQSKIDFIPENQRDVIARPFDLAYLVFNLQNTTPEIHSAKWDETFKTDLDISRFKFSLPLTSFLVNNKDVKHGRLHASALVRCYEDIKMQPTATEIEHICSYVDRETLQQCSEPVPAQVRFCAKHNNIIAGPEKDSCFGDGCFGGSGSSKKLWNTYLSPLGLDYTNSSGCFRGSNLNPTGCFSPTVPLISRMGCGLGSLLSLLALCWLLWSLFFSKYQNSSRNDTNTFQRTDTVYVEVFRELRDTLRIEKNFIDSTTTQSYEMVSLPNVQFFTDSDKLLPSSAKELQSLAEYLIKNDSLQATIIGHTDNTGDPKANLELSKRRAESVKRFLVSIGVKDANLQAVGKGDSQPKAPNTTEEGRLMNRRVEVRLEQSEISSTKRVPLPETVRNPNDPQ